MVAGGTKRGKDCLIDRYGYRYHVDRRRGERTYWRCCTRSTSGCGAAVVQVGNEFRRGVHEHIDPPSPGMFEATTARMNIKQSALADVFKSAHDIVDDELNSALAGEQAAVPCGAFARPDTLARAANRARQRMRPADPQSLDFELDTDFVPPNFFRSDVKVKNQRHLIFATDAALSVLPHVKTVYMDGTFKVVRKPFVQLFSLHAFVQCDTNVKQVPLVFILMSRRQTKDYRAVFRELRALTNITWKTIVSDFELALWNATREIFPGTVHRGCFFHWSQALLRHLRCDAGLQKEYQSDDMVRKICKLLFALPFLPPSDIRVAFDRIVNKVSGLYSDKLFALCRYVKETWIDSKVWPPERWSVYQRPIRTNNDCEGWHFRLNAKARKNSLPLYVMIRLLHREGTTVTWQMRMLSEGKVLRRRKARQQCMEAALYKLWTQFAAGKRSAYKLLRACSHLYAPTVPTD